MGAPKKHPVRDSKVVGKLAERMFPPTVDGEQADEELREIADADEQQPGGGR